MQISIETSAQLDTFARGLATHTKLKPTHIKTAIAKHLGIQRVSTLEEALDLAFQKFNDGVVAFDNALANKFSAKYISKWYEGTITTNCMISSLGKITDIETSKDGEDFEHLENESIEIIVGNTTYSFDVEDEQLAEHETVLFTDLLSKIKTEHIPETHKILNGNTSPILDNVDSHVMTEFMAWLGDNVDGGSDIHFDNDGEVSSQAVLDILQDIVLINCNVSVNAKRIENELKTYQKDIVSNVCAAAEVDTASELAVENWEHAEDAIVDTAKCIAKSDQLAKSIALLQQAGLGAMAAELESIAQSSMNIEYLRANV